LGVREEINMLAKVGGECGNIPDILGRGDHCGDKRTLTGGDSNQNRQVGGKDCGEGLDCEGVKGVPGD